MTELNHSALAVKRLITEYSIDTFVETGCFHGNGIQYVTDLGIKNIYSCDINNNFVNECKSKYKNAVIHNNDSISFLTEILPNLNSKTLFWLDAHYPAYYESADIENDINKFPLIEEMNLITRYKNNFKNDIIICDDLRVLQKDNPYYNGGLDNYFLIDESLTKLIDVFKNTHDYYTVNGDTGNIIFVPKL